MSTYLESLEKRNNELEAIIVDLNNQLNKFHEKERQVEELKNNVRMDPGYIYAPYLPLGTTEISDIEKERCGYDFFGYHVLNIRFAWKKLKQYYKDHLDVLCPLCFLTSLSIILTISLLLAGILWAFILIIPALICIGFLFIEKKKEQYNGVMTRYALNKQTQSFWRKINI